MPPNDILEMKAHIDSLIIANDAWRAVAHLNAMTIDRLIAENRHYRRLVADLQEDQRRGGREAVSDHQFAAGVIAGQADAALLLQPIDINGDKLSEYLRISFAYEEAVFAAKPQYYQRGYVIGFDAWVDAHPRTPAADIKEFRNV